MALTPLTALSLRGKRVLIRLDLNVPIEHGKITSATRIEAALDTIRLATQAGAKVMLMSHLGRPVEGGRDLSAEGSPARPTEGTALPPDPNSLAPIAAWLGQALGGKVKLYADYLRHPPNLADGEVVMLENVRFNVGEKANDAALAKRYAGLCDVFVMDAFAAAHRAHASTVGVTRYAPEVCAGPLLLAELAALGKALESPARPLVAIVGGAKVSTKLAALEALSRRVDQLIPGGGIANTLLAAAGHNIGQSLFESALVDTARDLLRTAEARGRPIPLPDDVVVGKAFCADSSATVKAVQQLADDDMIFDIGPHTVGRYAQMVKDAATVVWNGPLGVFEFAQFANGTEAIGRAIAASKAFSIVGGGDTLAAVERFHLAEGMSYLSTGGGAFLTLLEGETLPAVAALEARGEG